MFCPQMKLQNRASILKFGRIFVTLYVSFFLMRGFNKLEFCTSSMKRLFFIRCYVLLPVRQCFWFFFRQRLYRRFVLEYWDDYCQFMRRLWVFKATKCSNLKTFQKITIFVHIQNLSCFSTNYLICFFCPKKLENRTSYIVFSKILGPSNALF